MFEAIPREPLKEYYCKQCVQKLGCQLDRNLRIIRAALPSTCDKQLFFLVKVDRYACFIYIYLGNITKSLSPMHINRESTRKMMNTVARAFLRTEPLSMGLRTAFNSASRLVLTRLNNACSSCIPRQKMIARLIAHAPLFTNATDMLLVFQALRHALSRRVHVSHRRGKSTLPWEHFSRQWPASLLTAL